MSKKTPMRVDATRLHTSQSSHTRHTSSQLWGHSKQLPLRFVISLILLLGMVIVIVVGISVARELTQAIKGHTATSTNPITTFTVRRTAPYAGLDITVMNAQSAASFPDDVIHAGHVTIRLNLHIANKTPHPVNVVYYDIARLLIPHLSALTPTNVHLSTGLQANASEDGWLDYSLSQGVPLNTLTLQLGLLSLNETLVKIPFTGPFDASQYTDRIVQQSLTIPYNYYGHKLLYHLTGAEVRLAFHGSQCSAGQRYYILDFSVDNPEHNDISPGYGFDYVRLVLNGNDRPPIDNTLPYTFKANAKSVKGYVVFTAASGLRVFTLGLLSQNGSPEQDTSVRLDHYL